MPSEASHLERLCLSCGLCCDGTLFKDVELQTGDDVSRLKAIGLPIRPLRAGASNLKFSQPCVALGVDCRCGVYAERPVYCRRFECGLFKAVAGRRIEVSAGLRLIHTTRRRAERVRLLLRKLGDDDEHLPLSRRFKRMRRRLESTAPTEATASTFGQLTVAVHELNVALSATFYPGQVE
jgi:uncharacterized protein